MKKNIMKVVGGLFIAAALFFNFVLGNNISKDTSESLSLKNLSALQASAGEMTCDQSNAETCTITIKTETGSTEGKSTGRLTATY